MEILATKAIAVFFPGEFVAPPYLRMPVSHKLKTEEDLGS
jgi:hypothetical protein